MGEHYSANTMQNQAFKLQWHSRGLGWNLLSSVTHREPPTPARVPGEGSWQGRALGLGPVCSLSQSPVLLLPLCLHRTAFMMKWKISGQRRRQNGRRMRSRSGKRSCCSKVSTETSDVLMKNHHEAWSPPKEGSLGFTKVMSHMARLPNGRCLEFVRK